MPTTTPVYDIVIPSSGAEPADMYGVAVRLGESVEAAFAARDTPSFTNVTYNGAWTDFGGAFEEVSYAKIGATVWLRGNAKHGTTSTTGTVFTLPAGFRPAKTRSYRVSGGAGFATITIDNAGVVSVAGYVSSGSASAITFDGIAFDIAS